LLITSVLWNLDVVKRINALKLLIVVYILSCWNLVTLEPAVADDDSLEARISHLEEVVQSFHNKLDQINQRAIEIYKRKRSAPADSAAMSAADERRLTAMRAAITEIEEQIIEVSDQVEEARPGTKQFLLAGTGTFSYVDHDNTGDSSFGTTISPHLYWKIGERSLVESHVDIKLNSADETDVELEFAAYNYIFNDNVTVSVGKFLMPFGFFQEKIHTAWINRLPDEPLVVSNSGLAPTHDLGVQVRGAVPVEHGKILYATYVTNGPQLDIGDATASNAGKLDYDNFSDNNSNKAIGGRIGYAPNPAWEFGYSVMTAQVGEDESGFQHVDALLQDFDMSYYGVIPRLNGSLTFYLEYVLSEVDSADYGSGAFDNDRSGGYTQISYRPVLSRNPIYKNTEMVFRYDFMDVANAAPLSDEQRWTLGLNYWVKPNIVVKAAYQLTDDSRQDDGNIFFQTGVGF